MLVSSSAYYWYALTEPNTRSRHGVNLRSFECRRKVIECVSLTALSSTDYIASALHLPDARLNALPSQPYPDTKARFTVIVKPPPDSALVKYAQASSGDSASAMYCKPLVPTGSRRLYPARTRRMPDLASPSHRTMAQEGRSCWVRTSNAQVAALGGALLVQFHIV